MAKTTTASDLYREAGRLYRHRIDERSIRNGKLFCNLANTYHQLIDIGRAIVNYRRAEWLDAVDPNVLRYLEHGGSSARTRWMRTLAVRRSRHCCSGTTSYP